MKAIHLLTDHIGALTNASAEQVCCLQKRRPDLTEPRPMEMCPRHGFHRLPALQHLRQKVHHASETLELTHVNSASTGGQSAG